MRLPEAAGPQARAAGRESRPVRARAGILDGLAVFRTLGLVRSPHPAVMQIEPLSRPTPCAGAGACSACCGPPPPPRAAQTVPTSTMKRRAPGAPGFMKCVRRVGTGTCIVPPMLGLLAGGGRSDHRRPPAGGRHHRLCLRPRRCGVLAPPSRPWHQPPPCPCCLACAMSCAWPDSTRPAPLAGTLPHDAQGLRALAPCRGDGASIRHATRRGRAVHRAANGRKHSCTSHFPLQ